MWTSLYWVDREPRSPAGGTSSRQSAFDAAIWPTIKTRGDQRNASFISSFARNAHSSDREKVRVRARVRPCFRPIHFVRRDCVAKRAGSLYSVAQYPRSDVSRFDLWLERKSRCAGNSPP